MHWSTLRCMRSLLPFSLCCVAVASADQVTYTATISTLTQDCGNESACQPFDLSVLPFNSTMGTLDSISWVLTDFQTYDFYFSDTANFGDPPSTFSYTTTEGDTSSVLGLAASNTQD